MHRLLFANTKTLKRDDLDGFAKQVGLDMTKFANALDTHAHKSAIDADEKTTADAGVSGTPAFFIGPYFISGAQPFAKFKKLVDRVLTEPAPVPGGPARTLPGGLVVKDVFVGSGREVKTGDKVSVHYVGTLSDGKQFDSSRTRGTPFSFEVGKGSVIKGWEQGLVGMKIGGTRKLTIPSDLAYGDKGHLPQIPPKSTLVFDIELVSIQAP
jgi:peptidylprolyl isomerase/FKBP-type peptidyl-prolyl cis-trans isomerase FkpA